MNTRTSFVVAMVVATAAAVISAQAPQGKGLTFSTPSSGNETLTAVEGIKVGHVTLSARPTGCTVILFKDGTTGSVDQRGGAPGTRETDLLDPVNDVQIVNAISLAGGSAFGLDAASGVMRWLDEHHIGYPVGPYGVVPIVPAAILFDLPFGGDAKVRPGADCGYQAAAAATGAPVTEGNVGAGAGATVGKLAFINGGGPMKAGIGSAAIKLPNGLVVAAIVAVNAAGDIIDPQTGQVVAGVRGTDGKLADVRKLLLTGGSRPARAGENTTIGIVATNAKLTKGQAQKMAQMANDGYARTIYPSHTPAGGHPIFSGAPGPWDGQSNFGQVGAVGAEGMAGAVIRAAAQGTAAGGLPAARDLGTVPARFKK